MSTEFYNINAKDFYERTVSLDIKNLYEPFLERIEKGAHILDAGCGSGRDTKYFLEQGYKVTAFDGSHAMAQLASELTGQNIKTKMFVRDSNIDAKNDFSEIILKLKKNRIIRTQSQFILPIEACQAKDIANFCNNDLKKSLYSFVKNPKFIENKVRLKNEAKTRNDSKCKC